MISPWKVAALTVLCGSILGLWALENKGSALQERPISVSLEVAPCTINGSEKIKIALTSEVNGADLRYGRVVFEFWPLSETAATYPIQLQPVEGCTDLYGRFISLWHPPCCGKYLICARVSKSGCSCGQAISHVVVSK